MKTPKTKVIFRRWRRVPVAVIALLPEVPYDCDGFQCAAYQSVGQHSGADYYGVIVASRPAKPAEYRRLATELRRRGYRLDIRRRASGNAYAIRKAEIAKTRAAVVA